MGEINNADSDMAHYMDYRLAVKNQKCALRFVDRTTIYLDGTKSTERVLQYSQIIRDKETWIDVPIFSEVCIEKKDGNITL